MGFFSKLRANMNHGGVKVHVQAPASVPSNQVIPVQVTLTADGAQTVTSVKVELRAQMQQQGVSLNGGVGMQKSTTTAQPVAVAENREPISLSPGQPQTVGLQLFLSGNTSAPGMLTGLGNSSPVDGVMNSVLSATQAFNHVNYTYTLHASADVEGITLDPSDKLPIQLLPPTETPQPGAAVAASTEQAASNPVPTDRQPPQ